MKPDVDHGVLTTSRHSLFRNRSVQAMNVGLSPCRWNCTGVHDGVAGGGGSTGGVGKGGKWSGGRKRGSHRVSGWEQGGGGGEAGLHKVGSSVEHPGGPAGVVVARPPRL